MNAPSIAILAIGMDVAAIAEVALWLVSGWTLRVANTSQELLELFEDEATLRRGGPTLSAFDAAHHGAGIYSHHASTAAGRTVAAARVRRRWADAVPAQ
jgi:hypothetical protein